MSGSGRHYCVVMKRRPEVTRAEFLRVWLGQHRALALELPGVIGATFMPTAGDDERADGVGLLSFASQSDLERALNSDTARRLRAHTATFADSAAATRLVLRDAESFEGLDPTH
jgi:uncharacterized protein (TIGR02118 family)